MGLKTKDETTEQQEGLWDQGQPSAFLLLGLYGEVKGPSWTSLNMPGLGRGGGGVGSMWTRKAKAGVGQATEENQLINFVGKRLQVPPPEEFYLTKFK